MSDGNGFTPLTETMSYGDLIERINEMGNDLSQRTGKPFNPFNLEGIDEQARAWQITINTDPHTRWRQAIYEIQRRPRLEFYGLLAAAKNGQEDARYKVTGYCWVLSRCILKVEGDEIHLDATPETWLEALEKRDEQAENLDDLVLHVYYFYMFQRDSRPKSETS